MEWSETAELPFRLPVAHAPELRRATRLLRASLDRPLSIAELARASAMSERTLRRRFLCELRMSPRTYLQTARILAALDQLANPALSVTEVALRVGFGTPSAFTHAFTVFVGESPRQYRQRLRPAPEAGVRESIR